MSSAHRTQAVSTHHRQIPPNVLAGFAAPMLRHLRALARCARELTKEDIDNGGTYGGFLPAVCRRIEAYESSFSVAEETGHWIEPPTTLFPISIHRETVEGAATIYIRFAAGDTFVHTAGIEEEAVEAEERVREYHRLGEVFARAGSRLPAALQLEAEQTRQDQNQDQGSPRARVQNHIDLLRQYNDLKDVGQQLIGVVAENRGVPVGSLYDDEEFGVGSRD